MPTLEPRFAGLTKSGKPELLDQLRLQARVSSQQHAVGNLGQAGALEEGLADRLVHRHGRRRHTRAGIGYARELEQSLHRAVFAVGPVQHRKEDVGSAPLTRVVPTPQPAPVLRCRGQEDRLAAFGLGLRPGLKEPASALVDQDQEQVVPCGQPPRDRAGRAQAHLVLTRSPTEQQRHLQPRLHDARVYTRLLMSGFSFEVEARDGRARAGVLRTPHGEVETPVFMPVGTAAAVKAVLHRDLREIGARMLLANTYHLMLRPGAELIAELGGLHAFTGWDGPLLTDSGGYQVFSLAALRKLDEDGVRFQSHLDGTSHLLSPERSIEIQERLGADVAMAFDECPPSDAPLEAVAEATARTTRWARRSHEAHRRSDQWLFGIVQGGTRLELREQSARDLAEIGFPGYAIGGLSVGEPKPARDRVLEHLDPILAEDRPRYLMGVGTPEDLVDAVARGVDMFDCVLPTRNARNGQLFTRRGRLSIRNARFRDDPRPPDSDCPCPTCRSTSRAYLRHLHLANEMSAATLMSIHNLFFYVDTMKAMRQSIRLFRFENWRERTLRLLAERTGRVVAPTPPTPQFREDETISCPIPGC